ncbi:glycoside hydrolase family 3 N-terminal domain-containing protein [uncultured Alistipes sp.]|uniref:glycoside hydrolase family 3 N-terminal domain-containing protein n=1 Tax=uncultured Alistipes sp. TaxID=538949 RepID=UPI0025D365AA|nr:glycoside hydrolase family 3 N-terminal domain-containing protein [uncultured Alistipes sp.]
MNRTIRTLFVTLGLIIANAGAPCAQPYKDASLGVDERVADLLWRMTPEEKAGQLLCPLGWPMYRKSGAMQTGITPAFEQQIGQRHVGMLWAVFRADPWTRKTLENGLNPELSAQTANYLQKYAITNSRLGIPLFLAEEGPHGHMAIGTTVYPAGIGMAAGWSPETIRQIGKAVAAEVRAQGAHICYGPVMDISRDPRWSRVEESYGEDPYLTARIGEAMVLGHGNGKLAGGGVISTLKHFIAYGISEGGHNGNPSLVGRRALFDTFLPPFEAAVKAGALSVMTAYNSIDGVPCTANSEMLRDLLRERWGFKGFVVSDLCSIEGLADTHLVARDYGEAAAKALTAGVDVDLSSVSYERLAELLRDGEIEGRLLDEAVIRVLRLKFEMGLFENPYVDPAKAKAVARCPEHVSLALRAGREAIVLLENKNNTLPLDKGKIIAVIGPNADNHYNMLGDYTAPQQREAIATVLDGIRAKIGAERVIYAKGCAIRDTLNYDIAAAVRAAREADVAIVVVGGSSARDFKTRYIETGAAVADNTAVSDMESGEGFDRATLTLMGRQEELLRAVRAVGKPMIVVYIEGRPLDKGWAKENADALLTAWYPGQEGGYAVADVLFGDYNPAGRLPISVPRAVGQLPVYYNKLAPIGHDYVEMSALPLYEFGYGLSYTSFGYTGLQARLSAEGDLQVSFEVENTGDCDGEEVAQLYIRHRYAAYVAPVKELKGFRRVPVARGTKVRLSMTVPASELAIVDANGNRMAPTGVIDVMIGASSGRIFLEDTIRCADIGK